MICSEKGEIKRKCVSPTLSVLTSGSRSLSWDVKSPWPEEVDCRSLTLGHIHQLDHGRSQLLEDPSQQSPVGVHGRLSLSHTSYFSLLSTPCPFHYPDLHSRNPKQHLEAHSPVPWLPGTLQPGLAFIIPVDSNAKDEHFPRCL